MNRRYRRLASHRAISVGAEFRLYLRKLALMPWAWARNRRAVRAVRRGGFAYHVVLLQLEHDANFLAHSPFDSQRDFIGQVIAHFAAGAARHHHLVFKAHPLEDGRLPLRPIIRGLAEQYGLAERVHFLTGGKLAQLLDGALSAVTVNSTAAQQVLWRGKALRVFGSSVYSKPEFVSNQPLHAFFAQPAGPDIRAYLDYRQFLLETSQLPGNFYSARGRRQVLRQLTDALLRQQDPYDLPARSARQAAAAQHLRSV